MYHQWCIIINIVVPNLCIQPSHGKSTPFTSSSCSSYCCCSMLLIGWLTVRNRWSRHRPSCIIGMDAPVINKLILLSWTSMQPSLGKGHTFFYTIITHTLLLLYHLLSHWLMVLNPTPTLLLPTTCFCTVAEAIYTSLLLLVLRKQLDDFAAALLYLV